MYAPVAFPPDEETGLHRIEFTGERLYGLATAWFEYQFDPSKADAKLAAAGR
jgi:hypothetical protein